MTSFWTLDRVGDALAAAAPLGRGGHAWPRGVRALTGITTDTRAVQAGDVFLALRGERFDGHDFLRSAVSAGAAAVVVSRVEMAAGLGVPVFHVPDTLVALGALARYRRRAWGKTVITIAGSNGKTSTKELLRAALGARIVVHATTGNLNNQVGVPLTLLAIPDGADVAVVEIGTNAPGEVKLLTDITEPDLAIVTSIGEEHLEGLGDIAGVLREEAAAFDNVPLAIAPTAHPELIAAARSRARHVITAGLDDGDVRADGWSIDGDGRVRMEIGGYVLTPPLRGAHNARNTMLVMAAASACGVSIEDAARGIAAMPHPPMRSAWDQIGRVTIINDAYNSNPASARAALEMLGGAGAGRQRVAILGTMAELGAQAPRMHQEIAAVAVAAPVDIVAGIGDFQAPLAALGLGARVIVAPDVDHLWTLLRPQLQPDAIVLLKASRSVSLERLLPLLTPWAAGVGA